MSNSQTTENLVRKVKADVAPRVTPADIEKEIVSQHFFTAHNGVVGQTWQFTGSAAKASALVENMALSCQLEPLKLLTFCVLVLKNGFTVTGESACASPENFNEEVGRKVARENAIEKIWPLLGFRLRDALHTAKQTAASAFGAPPTV